MSKITNAKHAAIATDETPLHRTLRTRAVAALATGCLALSLCPAVAFAAPADQAGPQGGGAPAMQQAAPENDQQGFGGQPAGGMQQPGNQQPSAQQPSAQQPGDQQNTQRSGGMQQPGNQPGGQPGNSAIDDQIRTILSDQYGVNTALPGANDGQQPGGVPGEPAADGQQPGGNWTPGNPADAPAIPEGEVNVQQIIDSVRDVLRQYGADALESADFSDSEFTATLADYVNAALQDRHEMFANGTAPRGGAAQQAPDGQAPEDAPEAEASGVDAADDNTPKQAPADSENGQAGPRDNADSEAEVSVSVLDQIISFLMTLFGFNA